MKLFKREFTKDDLLYGGFIITFAILYAATALCVVVSCNNFF